MKHRAKTIPSLRTAASPARAGREIERFELLVDELSAVMAQSPADGVDAEIHTWLGKICLALGLDRSAIYERDGADQPVRTTHTWVRQNFAPFPRRYDPERLFKKTTDWIMAGNQLVFSDPEEIPFALDDAKRFVHRYGPKASAIIPMFAGERVIGAASFGRFRSPRQWHPQLLQQLGIAVRIFGGAIERKQTEMAARSLRADLTLAQRRSMAGQLVGSIAHELNQPLGAILSNLEGLARLLAQDGGPPALASKTIKNAIQDAKRAGEIVRRVRAIFKGDSAHKASTDIRSLAREVVELLANEAAFRGITLRIDDSPQVSRAMVDRIQIQQCIMNLLINGLDATAQIKSGPREVVLRITPENKEWIEVTVSDNGVGIDSAVASKLFEPFVTTKTGGMGLGLLVTRSIVEAHGGRLWFAANPNGGTAFVFTLPRALSSERHSQK